MLLAAAATASAPAAAAAPAPAAATTSRTGMIFGILVLVGQFIVMLEL